MLPFAGNAGVKGEERSTEKRVLGHNKESSHTMLNKQLRDEITALVKREVVPAVGCTEPVAVALCVAKAKEVLGTVPHSVEVRLSANVLKNAMGVGIPGTGMIGLPIAIALGAIVGRSED